MTQKAFFEKLAALPKRWKICPHAWTRWITPPPRGGEIRCKRGDCPIIAVFNATFPERAGEFSNSSYQRAAAILKLDITIADKIADAADNYLATYRDRLLDACGLQEAE